MTTDTMNIIIKKAPVSRIAEVDFNKLPFGKIFSDHMLVVEYMDGTWHQPVIMPYAKMEMSPSSAVIHYGQAIFEGMKAYKNESGHINLFRPLDNLTRLNISAKRMCMPELPQEIFLEGLKQLVMLDSDWIPTKKEGSLYIRPFMFASDEYIGVKASDSYKFIIITAPVGNYYTEPVKVLVENSYTRAVEGGVGYVKAAGNYGRSLYPAKIAQEKGYHQLIWTDAIEHKYIEESGTMNVMFVIGDTLVTPPTSTTILAGVTRDSVLTLARDWGMKVEERRINIDEIVQASEKGILMDAFGTGTAATIAHIELIGYQDIDYYLPSPESRVFSNKVSEELQKIRKGEAPDKHDWVVKLNH
jgi:branched-chain amino acid aminotransferase